MNEVIFNCLFQNNTILYDDENWRNLRWKRLNVIVFLIEKFSYAIAYHAYLWWYEKLVCFQKQGRGQKVIQRFSFNKICLTKFRSRSIDIYICMKTIVKLSKTCFCQNNPAFYIIDLRYLIRTKETMTNFWIYIGW